MGCYRPELLPLGTVIGFILVRVQCAPPLFGSLVYRSGRSFFTAVRWVRFPRELLPAITLTGNYQ